MNVRCRLQIGLVFCILMNFSAVWAKSSIKSTNLKDITRFQDLPGGQYTMGYGIIDGEEKQLAVYDKTFGHPVLSKYWYFLLLGTMGINDLNLAQAVKSGQSKQKKKQKKKLSKYFSELFTGQGDRQLLYPKDLYKNKSLPWRSSCKKLSKLKKPPKEILLSCFKLDLKKSKKNRVLLKFLSKLHNRYQDEKISKEGLRDRLLKEAKFVLKDEGYFLEVSATRTVRPVKAIDIEAQYSSFPRALAWSVMTNVAKSSIAAVPGWGVQNLLVAVMERMFNLIEVTFLIRHGMALHLCYEALDGNKHSPFYGQDQKNLYAMVTYLKRSSTLLSAMIKGMFKSKKTVGQRYYKKVQERRKNLLATLVKKGLDVHVLPNSFYAVALKRDAEDKLVEFRVYSLIKHKMMRHSKPFVIVDFLNLKSEYFKRNALEGILVASSFLWIPVPLVHTAVKIAYKEAVIREIHRRQMHEAGFKGHLNHASAEFRKLLERLGFSKDESLFYLQKAFQVVEKREVNPLNLKRYDERVQMKSVEAWIKQRDPSYVPLVFNRNY